MPDRNCHLRKDLRYLIGKSSQFPQNPEWNSQCNLQERKRQNFIFCWSRLNFPYTNVSYYRCLFSFLMSEVVIKLVFSQTLLFPFPPSDQPDCRCIIWTNGNNLEIVQKSSNRCEQILQSPCYWLTDIDLLRKLPHIKSFASLPISNQLLMLSIHTKTGSSLRFFVRI